MPNPNVPHIENYFCTQSIVWGPLARRVTSCCSIWTEQCHVKMKKTLFQKERAFQSAITILDLIPPSVLILREQLKQSMSSVLYCHKDNWVAVSPESSAITTTIGLVPWI
ncbi:hypothetical protein Plhal304r1_c027g0089421 [Plasmopara halstedii]